MKLVKEVESKEPKGIHLLVNNAGIARDDNTKYSNGKPDFKVGTFYPFKLKDAPNLIVTVRSIPIRPPHEV